MARLTKRMVDQIAPGDKETMHWDDELRGFGVRVWPSGRKVYMVMSRVKGRLRRITIGTHGAFTAEKARARARELLSEAKNGRDPAKELDQARKAPTMKGLGERFLQEHVTVRCKPATRAEYKRSVELFINPKLGTRKVTDIERKDVAELHQELQHTPYQANRTLSVLSKMFNLAEVWGLRPDGSNPCRHVKKYAEQKRGRFLDPAETAELGQVLREVEQDGSETKAAVNAIRLLMLTGCRLSEIMTLKWEEVDLKARELRLPDSKTGAKVVPFAKTAAAVLKGIEKLDDNPHVIIGKKPGSRLTDLQHPWRRIRSKAGLDSVRIHDLRHSYASGALALGQGLPMIGKLLGHTQVQTTARYAHLARDPVKLAGSRVSDTIGAAMLKKTKKNGRSKAVKPQTNFPPSPIAAENRTASEDQRLTTPGRTGSLALGNSSRVRPDGAPGIQPIASTVPSTGGNERCPASGKRSIGLPKRVISSWISAFRTRSCTRRTASSLRQSWSPGRWASRPTPSGGR